MGGSVKKVNGGQWIGGETSQRGMIGYVTNVCSDFRDIDGNGESSGKAVSVISVCFAESFGLS